jgi:arylsulfatase A-like enzyme
MPQILKEQGTHAHLVSDHYHYWEDGGCTYHTRYNSWQCSRGQEGDPLIGDLREPSIPDPNPERSHHYVAKQDWVNRGHMHKEEDFPQAKTFAMGMDYIRMNKDADNWFLHLETFDPHEPYYVPEKYKKLYDFDYSKIRNDWPTYSPENGREELSEHYRYLNAALISMCDEYLGKILDLMDELDNAYS